MKRRLFAVGACLAVALALTVPHTPVAEGQAQLTVLSPATGATVTGTSVTVSFRVANHQLVPTSVPLSEAGRRPEANRAGEGHMHFMLDTQPLVVWERADAYTFANVPPGEHVLMVELVQNDHGPLAAPISQTIRFRTTGLLASAGAGAAGAPAALGVIGGSARWLIVAGALALGGMGLALGAVRHNALVAPLDGRRRGADDGRRVRVRRPGAGGDGAEPGPERRPQRDPAGGL